MILSGLCSISSQAFKKVCENAVDILLQKVIAQKLSKYASFMIFMGKVVVKISYH